MSVAEDQRLAAHIARASDDEASRECGPDGEWCHVHHSMWEPDEDRCLAVLVRWYWPDGVAVGDACGMCGKSWWDNHRCDE